ncbi:MAG TPA: LuxR C-terminal-related transcriptional regulator [Candidatus Kapabacteria bacterium]|nr:LuxR C-terminal-related transcriptional regulator [Candidatus Kapabacteria bacterium]
MIAPAGFGKTTILGDWVRRDERRAGWLSLDPSDDTPQRFWQYLLGALQQVQPGIGIGTVQMIGNGEQIDFALTPLLNDLAGMAGSLALVLDDYHAITHPQIHRTLGFFIERMPQQMRLVISSRAVPPLSLARLRAQGDLDEIGETDLRFSPQETAALVRGVVDDHVSPETVHMIAEEMEGWSVMVQLAAQSVARASRFDMLADESFGRYRYACEYLHGEILDRMPLETLLFLRRTSILERLSASICSAITGRTDAGELLAAIALEHGGLLRPAERPGTFRLHRLAALMLRAELESREPERFTELHRRAAEWYEAQGLFPETVGHLAACGDIEGAARYAERSAEELLARRALEHLLGWQELFPDEISASRPRLALAFAWASLLTGNSHKAQRYAGLARRKAPGSTLSGLADLGGHLNALESALGIRQSDEKGALPSIVQSQATSGTRQAQFTTDRAQREDHRGQEAAQFGLTQAVPRVGLLQLAQGKLGAAMETFNRALEMLADRQDVDDSADVAAATCHIGLAAVAYERNRLDAAMSHLSEAITLGRALGNPEILRDGYVLLARVHQARGDVDGALDAVAEADRHLDDGMADLQARSTIEALRAGLWLHTGDSERAAAWCRRMAAAEVPDVVALSVSRILLAQQKEDDVVEQLGPVLQAAEEEGRDDTVIRATLLRALAYDRLGESDQALQCCHRVLTLAETEGYVRAIVDEGSAAARLLKKYRSALDADELPQPVGREYLDTLFNVLGISTGVPRNSETAPEYSYGLTNGTLMTPISDREIEVLRLIAEGKSNASIASALYISVSTVKTHINNLYSKLGVESRTQALARAREYNLL